MAARNGSRGRGSLASKSPSRRRSALTVVSAATMGLASARTLDAREEGHGARHGRGGEEAHEARASAARR